MNFACWRISAPDVACLASSPSLVVRCTWLSAIGDRAFPVATAHVWNGLPHHVTSVPSLSTFCNRLKTHLFSRCFFTVFFSAWSFSDALIIHYVCVCLLMMVSARAILKMPYMMKELVKFIDECQRRTSASASKRSSSSRARTASCLRYV